MRRKQAINNQFCGHCSRDFCKALSISSQYKEATMYEIHKKEHDYGPQNWSPTWKLLDYIWKLTKTPKIEV